MSAVQPLASTTSRPSASVSTTTVNGPGGVATVACRASGRERSSGAPREGGFGEWGVEAGRVKRDGTASAHRCRTA